MADSVAQQTNDYRQDGQQAKAAADWRQDGQNRWTEAGDGPASRQPTRVDASPARAPNIVSNLGCDDGISRLSSAAKAQLRQLEPLAAGADAKMLRQLEPLVGGGGAEAEMRRFEPLDAGGGAEAEMLRQLEPLVGGGAEAQLRQLEPLVGGGAEAQLRQLEPLVAGGGAEAEMLRQLEPLVAVSDAEAQLRRCQLEPLASDGGAIDSGCGHPYDNKNPTSDPAVGQRVQFEEAVDDGHHVQFRDCVENGYAHQCEDPLDDDEESEMQDNFCMSLHSSSSSSSSSDGYSDQFSEARAPDGGWGWVVVFASFMVNLIADGITFSFGVIFLEFVKYFGEGKSKTAWIGSLFLAIPLLSGPIASYLTDRYGCRRVCIAGGVLAAAGFVISAFIDSVEALFFTFGILSGFGLSLCYVAAIVIVAYYFEKRRAFATGLSVCGSGIGTFVFPPFIEFLIDQYAWRGATMILAGLFLNLCVCGALMRDLEYTKKHKRKKKDRKLSATARPNRNRVRANTASSADSASQYSQHHASAMPSTEEVRRLLQVAAENSIKGDTEEEAGGDYVTKDKKDKLFSSLVSLPTFVRNGEKVPLEVLEGLSTNRHLYAVLVHNYPSLLISSRSISDSGCINEQKRHRHACTATPKYSAQFLPDQKLVSPDDNRPSKEESQNSKSVSRQETFSEKDGEWKKPEKRRSILKKKSESLKRGLAAVNNANSTWWNKRDTSEYGNDGPRLPTAYLRDLKVHRHSLTYRGAMLNIGRYRLRASSCPDIYRNSMTTIAEEKDEWYAGLLDLWYAIADMMDFSYFKNVTFLLFAISNFMLYTWYDVPYVYVADHAVERGFSKTDSIYIISVIGILNMLGEIAFGWAGDRSWVNSRLVYAISIALCGIFIVIIPILDSYENICIVSGGFGFLVAANYSLTSIILVESISLEKFTNAYGLLLLVQGVGNLVGPPIAGWLYEINNDFTLPFFLAGVFISISGALLEVSSCFNSVRKGFGFKHAEVNGAITRLNSNENLKSKMNNAENQPALIA